MLPDFPEFEVAPCFTLAIWAPLRCQAFFSASVPILKAFFFDEANSFLEPNSELLARP